LPSLVQAPEAEEEDKRQNEGAGTGTFMEFEQDPEIFKRAKLQAGDTNGDCALTAIEQWVKLVLKSDGQPEPTSFQSRLGLMDLVLEDLEADGAEPMYHPASIHQQDARILFPHTNSRYGETFYWSSNGQYTSGRRHALKRPLEGRLKAVNEYGNAKIRGDDVPRSDGSAPCDSLRRTRV